MTLTLTRDLPDAALLVRAVLLQAGVPVGPDVPPNLRDECPRFTCYRSGGQVATPRLMDRPIITVIAWGLTYEQARDLGQTGEALLMRAWLQGWSSAEGRIGKVTILSASSPVDLANTPYDVHRFDATYRMNTRPAVP
jgi:hypothetical protein